MIKYLDDPKVRGLFTTVISGSSSSALHLITIGIGMHPILSTILTFYIFGSLIAYSLDILFAKQSFIIGRIGDLGKKTAMIPYSDLLFRIRWLFKSFFSMTFYRFIITVVIDTLIGIAILSSILNVLNSSGVHFWLRDTIIAGLVALVTFILYNNVLRFDWAYKDQSNPIIDIMVLMWASLVILIFSLLYKLHDVSGAPKDDKKEEKDESDIPKPVRMSWTWQDV